MAIHTTTRTKRKSVASHPDLFTWSQDAALVTSPAIRIIMRRAQVSPAVAALVSELSGFGRETAHV